MSSENFLRVEKGHAAPEELAALTAVLLARAAATTGHHHTGTPRPHRTTVRWHRQHRPGFRAPHSWQH
jgi:hypothetical protein